MSTAAMAWAWEQNTASHVSKLVLLALADSAAPDGDCVFDLRRLGNKVQMDTETLQGEIAYLGEWGLLDVVSDVHAVLLVEE